MMVLLLKQKDKKSAVLAVEDPEKKKKKEENARDKELKKLKAAQKAKAAKIQAKKGPKSSKKKNVKREAAEENATDYVDPHTSSSEKKGLSSQISKQYNPIAVENLWYQWWEKFNFFVADSSSTKPPFVIVYIS